MSADEVQRVRAQAQALVRRALDDEAFRTQLHADPEGTLRAEGLPDDAIADFARETELADVAGYVRVRGDDCTFTCVITKCGNSTLI